MPTLNQLLRNRVAVEIPTADENDPLRVVYQPTAITPRLFMQLDASGDLTRSEQMMLTADCLVAVVHSWNLNRADGSIIPLTRDALLDEVDYETQLIILNAIQDDSTLKKTSATPSSTPSASTSSRKAQRATSRP